MSETICPRCDGNGYLTLWGKPREDVVCGECRGEGVMSEPTLVERALKLIYPTHMLPKVQPEGVSTRYVEKLGAVVMELADALVEKDAEIRGLHYMISCENYDEHYNGKPCAGIENDELGKLRHRCLLCQIRKRGAEIEQLSEDNINMAAGIDAQLAEIERLCEEVRDTQEIGDRENRALRKRLEKARAFIESWGRTPMPRDYFEQETRAALRALDAEKGEDDE
jgi:hypothetical protein